MNIRYLGYNYKKYNIELDIVGNSDAIQIPEAHHTGTIFLSKITLGSATVEFTLSTVDKVKNDTALWHPWSANAVSKDTGFNFSTTITHVRVIADSTVTSTIEICA